MRTRRRIYPILFATWMLMHSVAALFIVGRWTTLGASGSEGAQSIAWAYGRMQGAIGEEFWLPKNVWVMLSIGWILIMLVALAGTAALRLLARKTGTVNELRLSLNAVTWAASTPTMLAIVLIAAGLTVVMANTDWVWLLPIPLSVSYCLATHEPTIRANGIRFDWRLFKARAPSLFLAVAGYTCMLGAAAGVTFIGTHFYWPIRTILDAVLYVVGLVIGGVLLSISLYGFSSVRITSDFRRFSARRWILAWLYIDYRSLVIGIWALPPIVLAVFFGWFAVPSIHFQASQNGELLPIAIRFLMSALDAFQNFWFIVVPPIVVGFQLLARARLLIALDSANLDKQA